MAMVNQVCVDDDLYLHPTDTTGSLLILFQFIGAENYQLWSYAVREGLLVKNKQCFIDGSCPRHSVLVHQPTK